MTNRKLSQWYEDDVTSMMCSTSDYGTLCHFQDILDRINDLHLGIGHKGADPYSTPEVYLIKILQTAIDDFGATDADLHEIHQACSIGNILTIWPKVLEARKGQDMLLVMVPHRTANDEFEIETKTRWIADWYKGKPDFNWRRTTYRTINFTPLVEAIDMKYMQ